MRLLKWNREKRRLEDVDVLDAKRITLAEVMQNGVVEQRVFGRGQRPLKRLTALRFVSGSSSSGPTPT